MSMQWSIAAKSLFLLVLVALQDLGATKQARGEMKICHGERRRGSNSALTCLRHKLLDGQMKRGMKVRNGNHFLIRLDKIWPKFLVKKPKSKKQIKGQKRMTGNKEKIL